MLHEQLRCEVFLVVNNPDSTARKEKQMGLLSWIILLTVSAILATAAQYPDMTGRRLTTTGCTSQAGCCSAASPPLCGIPSVHPTAPGRVASPILGGGEVHSRLATLKGTGLYE